MDDFGRILDEWESGRRTRFEQELERYPVVDKDARSSDGHDSVQPSVRPERLPVDDSIDLHGRTVEEAIVATEQFLGSSVTKGLKKVVVIHGKGRDGQGILKREIRAYLERHPSTGAMGYTRGPEGGRGALWVVLRSRGR